jgi:hypothetical protein
MTYKSAWEGNWKKRVENRIREKGYENLISFAEHNPKKTFFELAQILGEQIAPIQVEQLLSEAYYEQSQYPRYLRSALSRHIRLSMPQGWHLAQNWDYQVVDAILSWERGTPDVYDKFTKKVLDLFKNATNIPQGWLPDGADDPIILEIFKQAGFREIQLLNN